MSKKIGMGTAFEAVAVKNQNYLCEKDETLLSSESLTMLRRLPQTPRRLLRRGRGALNVLLMSVPPVFNIGLVSLLSYYTVHHNNDSVNWALFAAFIDAQLLFNWIQFLRFQSYITPSKRNFPGKLTKFFYFIDFVKLDDK